MRGSRTGSSIGPRRVYPGGKSVQTASARNRARKPKPIDPSAMRIAEFERENVRRSEKLRRAEIIIEFQDKVQNLLRMHENGEAKSPLPSSRSPAT